MARGAPLPWLKPGLFIGALAPLGVMVLSSHWTVVTPFLSLATR